ncbi:MAG: multiubiquitin domain-containing protein [Acidobacteria bacterium]|nr:multiubiquitin domain-containing protein [Acidobacteriota bacterium]
MSEKQHEVRIHIDQNPYQSPNPTTGEALYKLGDVPLHHELYREVTGNKEDEVIPNNGDKVHLKEDEHFHTGPREFTIIVNARKKTVAKKKLTFDEIVHLAFNPVPTGPNIMFTITYRHGPPANPEGSLMEGKSVRIKDGMIFDVTPTDKS